jgi:hypothetical protein
VPSSSRTGAALEGARAWQSQAEEKAKEAEGLRDSLADKAVALVTAEEQLCQERAARQQAEDQLQLERAALTEARARLSGNAWRERRHWVGSSRSAPCSRGRKRPSSSGRTRPRSLTGSWSSSTSH